MQDYNKQPIAILKARNREIASFMSRQETNIDEVVKDSFGDEWEKFHSFSEEEINKSASEYFDIVSDSMLSRVKVLDVGCGSGRWAKYIAGRCGFVEAIDPSSAVFAADVLLKDTRNVRITQAGVDSIPFADGSFDFVMSIGVLHHVPDTAAAIRSCAAKVKQGGYLYLYLYYALDNRSGAFKFIFKISNLVRKAVSVLPSKLKHLVCDFLAVTLYMPWVLLGRGLKKLGMKKTATKLPLSIYQDKSFYIIRNDALDRFGTTLEQRFTRQQIEDMLLNAGLANIKFSENVPYWHCVGQKK